MNHHTPITLARLQNAQAIAARVVRDHGETYLPLFVRINDELETKQKNQTNLTKALDIAENGDDKYVRIRQDLKTDQRKWPYRCL